MRDGSVVVLQNEQAGRFWISERLKAAAFNGCWSFPGGAIEEGEEPEATAVRELEEETGIQVKTSELQFMGRSIHATEPGTKTYTVYWFYLKTNKKPIQTEDKFGPCIEVEFHKLPSFKLTPGTFTMAEKAHRSYWRFM